MNEQQLIDGCKRGQSPAQKALFEQYSKGMLLLCRRYVKDHHHAEEVLIGGFQKFFVSIDRFVYGGDGRIGRWIKKIMINECLLFLRNRTKVVFSTESYPDEVPIDDGIVDKMSAAEILKHVNALPEGFRLVFNLYVVEGFNHREIAELLDISDGTSKSQLSRARTLLKESLMKNEIIYER